MVHKSIHTVENYIKISSLIVAFTIQYAAIKSDLRDLKTERKYQHEHFQYQIDELKDCCNDRNRRENKLVFKQPQAIQPHEIELENDKQEE